MKTLLFYAWPRLFLGCWAILFVSCETDSQSRGDYPAHRVYYRGETVPDEPQDEQNENETAQKHENSDEQVRLFFSAISAAGLTEFAKSANENSDPVSRGAAILARRARAEIITNQIQHSFPDLTPFQVRTVTRVCGMILDGTLTPENMAEQTIRGEILHELKSAGGDTEVNAEVGNFLYLLFRSYSR